MLSVSVHSISPNIVSFIESSRNLLTADFSNYAKGRLRAWIGLEAPLSKSQQFRPAPFGYDSVLWKWLQGFCQEHLNFDPEIGLLHVGGADCSDPEERPENGRNGECGIAEHRDASYADYRAVGINLAGVAVFGYRPCYPLHDRWSAEQDMAARIQHVRMVPGSCVVFNCKNPHFAQVGPNRWCVNAWRISPKLRADFETSRTGGGPL